MTSNSTLLGQLQLKLLLVLLMTGCGRSATPQLPGHLSIVGGQPTKPGEYSEVVALLYRETPICSGTVIGPRHILSAAHCVERFIQSPVTSESFSDLVIFVGENASHPTSSQLFSIKKISIHPEFWRSYLSSNDFALIETNLELPTPTAPLFVERWNSPRFIPATDVAIVGFGLTNSDDDRTTSSSGIKNRALSKVDGFAGDDLYVGNDQSDSCSGDSGGPVFLEDNRNQRALAAVTSRGPFPCAQEREPGIATLIHAGICWISEVVDPNNLSWQLACAEQREGSVLSRDEVNVNATSLELANRNLKNLDVLKEFPQIESLDLSSNQISDASVLLNLPKLKTLDLRNNRIADLSIFSKFKQQGVNVIGAFSQEINLDQTEYLRLSSLGSAAGVDNRATIMALREKLTNGSAERKGRDLAMRRIVGLNNKGVRSLASLSNLENLERLLLRGNNAITDFSPLLSLPRLKFLDIRDIEPPTDPLQLKVLETLRARGVQIATSEPIGT